MSYKMVGVKKDGTREYVRMNDDGVKEVLEIKPATGKGSKVKAKYAAFNFSGLMADPDNPDDYRLSATELNQRYREHMSDLRAQYVSTKGWSKNRTIKHVAAIPAEIFFSEMAEKGSEAVRDPKALKNLASEWGCRLDRE